MREYRAVDMQGATEDGVSYLAFGILAPSGTRIDDITTDFDAFASFLFRLNHCGASELHLLDFIADFIP